ncbi:MAG: hypothetical protein CVV42_03270 [Candidatus Riflebacteria bacterium HGW-Riflebacteria-2]|nr:MAG: hypothetical protein CVV42_03270 [Candidatus Riflebacteria bacterium HGW-Riflebacteria-2]
MVLILAGCGGGGGGSSDYTLSPEELEVATAVEAFAAAVKTENLASAMSYVFSNLKYFNSIKPADHTEFQKRLENLFEKATVVDFTITNIGVNMGGEDFASIIGQLTLVYSVDGSVATLSESIDISLERDSGKWGFTQISGRNELMITAFPPAL